MTTAKTSKKTTKNKSMNENMLKQSFMPLTSAKDGKSRGTFSGIEHSQSKDGVPYLKLVFSVLDETHENPANIAILCNYRYHAENKLGKTLAKLGYIPSKKVKEIIDADDEFGYKVVSNDTDLIFDFLREKCGLVCKLYLERLDNGLYKIDIESIEIMRNKDGSELYDYLPSAVDDDAFTSPKIDMSDNLM